MEETFQITVKDRTFNVVPGENEDFTLTANNSVLVSRIQRSLDEFKRWEQIDGALEEEVVQEAGEQIERYYM